MKSLAPVRRLVARKRLEPAVGAELQLVSPTSVGYVAGYEDSIDPSVAEILEGLEHRSLVAGVADVDVAKHADLQSRAGLLRRARRGE